MVWTRHLCRICARIGDVCYPIFDQNCGHDIDVKMNKCFSLAVCRDDYKPKEVCSCCYAKLNQFCDFIELCHASNNKFETMIYSTHQGVWLEKQAHEEFEECQMGGGVIVNTKSNLEGISHVMSAGYDGSLSLNHQDGGLPEANYVAPSVDINVDYIPEPTDLNKQTNNGCYDHNQTVLRHSSDFYKHDSSSYNAELNYINLRLVNYDETYGNPLEIDKADEGKNCEFAAIDERNKQAPDGKHTKTSERKRNKFGCQHCGKMFVRKINLNAHLALHSKLRPFSCDVCHKSFAISRYLTCHKRVHTDMYRCKHCAKNFSAPSKLRRHLQIHADLKPYICPVDGCGKSFTDKYNLVGHRMTHSAVKEFVCDVCSKGYKTISKLKDHRKVHSSDAPFKCAMCDKTYKWKANLTVHMKKHDGYKCTKCERDCEKLSGLIKHRKACKGS